jgi:hypothetical protein
MITPPGGLADLIDSLGDVEQPRLGLLGFGFGFRFGFELGGGLAEREAGPVVVVATGVAGVVASAAAAEVCRRIKGKLGSGFPAQHHHGPARATLRTLYLASNHQLCINILSI